MKSQRIKDRLVELKGWGVEHLVESTAMLAESTPLFAISEAGFSGMSDEMSIKARFIAAGFTYFLGLGFLYSKGRDLYRKRFGITDKSRERVQTLNDAAYTGLFNLVLGPPMYLVSGVRDTKEIAWATLGAVLLGLANGIPMGYAVDSFKDLTGLKTCERRFYLDLVRRQNPMVKKGLAALLTAGSIALTAGIYAWTGN